MNFVDEIHFVQIFTKNILIYIFIYCIFPQILHTLLYSLNLNIRFKLYDTYQAKNYINYIKFIYLDYFHFINHYQMS